MSKLAPPPTKIWAITDNELQEFAVIRREIMDNMNWLVCKNAKHSAIWFGEQYTLAKFPTKKTIEIV